MRLQEIKSEAATARPRFLAEWQAARDKLLDVAQELMFVAKCHKAEADQMAAEAMDWRQGNIGDPHDRLEGRPQRDGAQTQTQQAEVGHAR